MKEIWKPIQSNLGLYEVSDQGRVRRRTDGKLLKTDRPARLSGYCRVGLKTDTTACGYHTRDVHRLVALAFLPKPSEAATHVHHKNGIKTDNRAANLEWLEPGEHSRKDAELRKARGIRTKAHENWLARKKLAELEKLAHKVT